MAENLDLYESYYAEKLWLLLPEVYRAQDAEVAGEHGPMRELVNRIGVQAAVVRRSIDRLWEDQSIESCDDWAVPYMGELLATDLVAGLDARGQRLDVAKTIYYRRRKGTVGLLEELAADITGWNARVVEFFRRLSRTRHQFDPPVGEDRTAAVIQGLTGALSGTHIGGFADLRNAGSAEDAHTALDEFFHTADFRRGRRTTGWHNIPKLGVFLWRLESFACPETTPVEHASCPGQFTFDPTGREIPLFARNSRDPEQYGDAWVTPDEWMLPTPITPFLLEREQLNLYPDSVDAIEVNGFAHDTLPFGDIAIDPERGRLRLKTALAGNSVLRVQYHYGFSSRIGAGPYDRRSLTEVLPAIVDPEQPPVSGGGAAFDAALTAAGTTGTVSIADSLTYTAVSDVPAIDDLHLRSSMNQRPVLRLAGPAWTLTGNAGAKLTIQGLTISGADVVLQGEFESVTIFCSTLDPGEEDPAKATAIDGKALSPTRLWIEGRVNKLVVHRSIIGPIHTRGAGTVQNIEFSDTIVQAVRTSPLDTFTSAQIKDAQGLLRRMRNNTDALSVYLRSKFSAAAQTALTNYDPSQPPPVSLVNTVVAQLNTLLADTGLFSNANAAAIPLSDEVKKLASQPMNAAERRRFSRLILEQAYAVDLADCAIAATDAELTLRRTTVLGPVFAHRLSASECILNDYAEAEDAQSGCVRFSAYAAGSRIRQPYECAETERNAALFTSRRYGQPGYAQLLLNVYRIRTGAEDGSEMGVFCREKGAIRERGLRLKLNEFMPVGLTPVLVYVT